MVSIALHIIGTVAVVDAAGITLSYLSLGVVAPVAVVIDSVADIVIARTVLVIPAPSLAQILVTDGHVIVQTISVYAALGLGADMRLAGGTRWATSRIVATADLAGVVRVTVLSGSAVRVHNAFVLAHAKLTRLIRRTVGIGAALRFLANVRHTVATFAAVRSVATPGVAESSTAIRVVAVFVVLTMVVNLAVR